jgi:hypothetical protein
VVLAILLLVIVHILIVVPLVPLGKADTWTGWDKLTDRLGEELEIMPPGSFVFSRGYEIASEVAEHFCPQLLNADRTMLAMAWS